MWWFLVALLLAAIIASYWSGGQGLERSAWQAFDSSVRMLSSGQGCADQRDDDSSEDDPEGSATRRQSPLQPSQAASAAAADAAHTRRRVTPYQKKMACANAAWKCQSCSRVVGADFEVDHSRPLWAGGTNEADNLACICRDCHRLKTSLENSQRRLGIKRQKRPP